MTSLQSGQRGQHLAQHIFRRNISAVTVAAGVALFVFLPQQFQGQVLVSLKFFVDGGKIRRWMDAATGRIGPLTEQQLVEFLVAEVFRQWPTELGGPCQFQVFVNSALDDRATAGDLVLSQPQGGQPQDLAELAHGQSLFRQI